MDSEVLLPVPTLPSAPANSTVMAVFAHTFRSLSCPHPHHFVAFAVKLVRQTTHVAHDGAGFTFGQAHPGGFLVHRNARLVAEVKRISAVRSKQFRRRNVVAEIAGKHVHHIRNAHGWNWADSGCEERPVSAYDTVGSTAWNRIVKAKVRARALAKNGMRFFIFFFRIVKGRMLMRRSLIGECLGCLCL